jgi:hypothetical protein
MQIAVSSLERQGFDAHRNQASVVRIMSDDAKTRWASALANLRWKKKSQHSAQAKSLRDYWSKIAPDKRAEIMRDRRAKGLSKDSHKGLPGNASDDTSKTS